MAEENRILDLARLVADGVEPDWALEESRSGEDEQPAVHGLRLISGVSQAHRKLEAQDQGEDPEPLGEWAHLELQEKIGSGAFGDVYRARDTQLDREVALKLLRPDLRRDASQERSLKEGRLLARIKHENVATVYGAARHGGRVGIWMEFIRGRNLKEIITENGPLGAREATLIGIDLCRALAAVHAKGILHRDIKAQNVMREEGGRIVLMDFGIGRDLDAAPSSGRGLAGTPLYLAPEVLEGEPETVQSDIYSLGVLLFFLVTGKFPVTGDSLEELKGAHRKGESTLLRDLRQDLPETFLGCVERSLARGTGQRYETLGQIEGVLSSALLGSDFEIPDPGPVMAGTRSRLPLLVRALAVVAAFLTGPILLEAVRYSRAMTILATADAAMEAATHPTALNVLEPAFEVFPDFVEGYWKKAKILDALSRYDEANRAYATAASLSRERYASLFISAATARRTQAYLHVRQMQYTKARPILEQAAWLGDSLNAEDQHQLAMLTAGLGNFTEALELAKKAHELEPDHDTYAAQVVIQYVEAGLPDEALQFASAYQPREASGLRHLAWGVGLAHLLKEDLAAAGATFQEMIRDRGSLGSIGYRLAAQVEVQEALRSEPGGVEFRTALGKGQRLLELGLRLDDDLYSASGSWRDVDQRISTKKGRKLLNLARLRLLQGDSEGALRATGAVEKMVDAPPALKHFQDAGTIYAQMGRQADLDRVAERIHSICSLAPSRVCEGIKNQLSALKVFLEGDSTAALDKVRLARDNFRDPLIIASSIEIAAAAGACEAARAGASELEEFRGRILNRHFAGLLERGLEASRGCVPETQSRAILSPN